MISTVVDFFESATDTSLGYEKASFDAGYSAAVRDQMGALLRSAEVFLAQHPGQTPEQRQLILSFVAYAFGNTPEPDATPHLEDGLGI